MGYPLITAFSIILSKNSDRKNKAIANANCKNVDEYLERCLFFVSLLNEEIKSKNENSKSSNNKSQVLLKGYISLHSQKCIREDCPITLYNNAKNDNVKKICLINYINSEFIKGLKIYPNSHKLALNYIHFNISKKINMNQAKLYLNKLDNLELTPVEEYMLYTIKKNMNQFNKNNEDSDVELNEIEIKEEEKSFKYKRFKFLIEETTKTFSDFWGNLSSNLITNLNINKIYTLGKKLNGYLNEINSLWNKDLKNEKIEPEYYPTVSLYFLY